MGSVVSSLRDALCWDGVAPMISCWLVARVPSAPELDFSIGTDSPESVSIFEMSRDVPMPEDIGIFEYDLRFESLPDSLEGYLREILLRAVRVNGIVAWLGFEGSFHYDHLLTDDIAPQVYGLCSASTDPLLAVHEVMRNGDSWRDTMRLYREELVALGL
ncbi:hypothetical protein GCM10027589_59570 [Actinocorallia lasiicapitis]